MHKKTRLSVFVITIILLFYSSLSGCSRLLREAGEQGIEMIPRVKPDPPNVKPKPIVPLPSPSEEARIVTKIASDLGINTLDIPEARAAQQDYPQINNQAQQIYAAMVQDSGYESLAQANDAVQLAADQQNMVITAGGGLIAIGVAFDYAYAKNRE
jgi:hypothetical protein